MTSRAGNFTASFAHRINGLPGDMKPCRQKSIDGVRLELWGRPEVQDEQKLISSQMASTCASNADTKSGRE